MNFINLMITLLMLINLCFVDIANGDLISKFYYKSKSKILKRIIEKTIFTNGIYLGMGMTGALLALPIHLDNSEGVSHDDIVYGDGHDYGYSGMMRPTQ
ncbi:hypothetical protein BLOT_014283 [Blomia tropicalis]|nr:hypothetical protein BLOT_014283 [Blomia tropicalis]